MLFTLRLDDYDDGAYDLGMGVGCFEVLRQLLVCIDYRPKHLQSYRDLRASASDVMLLTLHGGVHMHKDGDRHSASLGIHTAGYFWSFLIISWSLLLSTSLSDYPELGPFMFSELTESNANELYYRKMFIGGLNWETTDRKLALVYRPRDNDTFDAKAYPCCLL